MRWLTCVRRWFTVLVCLRIWGLLGLVCGLVIRFGLVADCFLRISLILLLELVHLVCLFLGVVYVLLPLELGVGWLWFYFGFPILGVVDEFWFIHYWLLLLCGVILPVGAYYGWMLLYGLVLDCFVLCWVFGLRCGLV